MKYKAFKKNQIWTDVQYMFI